MKIGLYGGSFNPLHFGHMEVLNEVLDRNIVDEMWIMPCRNHVFGKDLAPIEHRLAMLHMAFDHAENVRIEDLEARLDRPSRTAESLRMLRKMNPQDDFYMVAGSDVVNDIGKWHDAGYIRKTTPFIVVRRPGCRLDNDFGVKLEAVIDGISNISSTKVRDNASVGLSLRGLVPKDIAQYIEDHGLYKRHDDEGQNYFRNPACTVDMIVPVDGGILFVKRKHEPYKGFWAFPGGCLEYGKETVEEAGIRELYEETGLTAENKDMEFIGVYSDPKRDPRGHFISHAYWVKNYMGIPVAGDDAAEVRVFKGKPKDLAFDHMKIYDDFLKYRNGN